MLCVHRIPRHVRDDAYAPSSAAERNEETSISEKTKAKYFCEGIWTTQISLMRFEKSVFARGIFRAVSRA
jgi:hypothetical protein